MISYIIDGNNLIGKIDFLKKIRLKHKNQSREKLAFILERYFSPKNVKVTLHFDGFPDLPIKVSKIKIVFSETFSADEKIKKQIESSKNSKNLIVVTSDNNLKEFSRVCGAKVMSSEKFSALIATENNSEEEEKIKMIDNPEEFKKIFGLK